MIIGYVADPRRRSTSYVRTDNQRDPPSNAFVSGARAPMPQMPQIRMSRPAFSRSSLRELNCCQSPKSLFFSLVTSSAPLVLCWGDALISRCPLKTTTLVFLVSLSGIFCVRSLWIIHSASYFVGWSYLKEYGSVLSHHRNFLVIHELSRAPIHFRSAFLPFLPS